ncbi:MAG: methylenetetrahydrofolate dehydrogenase (NADP+)/methenyltetrahydrofolate cyclohydrolase [Planctomycetota bacterium]|jgi:methylenetetrahydrofolate dehydrogenase (NADP+)/methenyltetrahydrofolate cyclohydrolase
MTNTDAVKGSTMTAQILDGKATAKAVRGEVAGRVASLRAAGVAPGLAVVLVGDDAASLVYVRNKDRAGTEVGLEVQTVRLPANASQAELMAVVDGLNRDDSVHGILVQLPLPKGLDSAPVLRLLDPAKDVDGLHPENVARLWRGEEGLVPCTPAGCIEILDRHGIAIEGQRAVVIGRSQLVGKPLAALLLARNATVTLAHSKTRDLPGLCREADILVAAVGRAEMVRGDWIRPGAAVLDVGINRTESGSLVGDVAFEEAREKAGAITPVPGGIGPMTIAMLLSNTVLAAARANGIDLGAQSPTEH